MNKQSGFEPPPQYSGMGIAFHTIYCGILERGFVISNGETTHLVMIAADHRFRNRQQQGSARAQEPI